MGIINGRFKQGADSMKAVIYEAFGAPPQLKNVPDPTPEVHGVVVKVKATGVCRSDWHHDLESYSHFVHPKP
jgi:D-arabinose 1-dehydrogenase-like Zn-dependent alcohol dehydrogenase